MTRMLAIVLAAAFMAASAECAAAEQPPAKKSTYSVLQVIYSEDEVKFEVIADQNVKSREQEIMQFYDDSVAEWEKEKKEAAKKKEEFDDPKPVKPKIKLLKFGLSEEKANEVKAKYEAEEEKKQEERKKKEEEKRKKEEEKQKEEDAKKNK